MFLSSVSLISYLLVRPIDSVPLLIYAADMSSTAFIEPLPVIDFVAQLLNRDIVSRPLSDADRIKVSYFYRGLHLALCYNLDWQRAIGSIQRFSSY